MLNDPNAAGALKANCDLEVLCVLILDNWRDFTQMQRSVACTVMGYAHPAEMVSPKQKYHLDQAQRILENI